MLLKCPQSEKRSRANASSKQQRSSSSSTTESSSAAMKLTTLAPRLHRKAVKKTHAGEARVAAVDPCDNSNDSGLGFDNHLEYHHLARTTVRFADQEHTWTDDHPDVKRKKLEIKLESDDANDDFSFPETVSLTRKRVDFRGSAAPSGTGDPSTVVGRRLPDPQARPQQRQVPARPPRNPGGPASLNTQLTGVSSDGRTHLQILCQPEQQHRARYQTEGSRGAVKDRSGNGFPVVKLVGYDKPATLQVFIGTDLGRVAPHMFYQACRVSGKNSTPCVEKKIDGTVVIEVDFDPAKDMVVTCDCVGILKERNVDVEHRFPDQSGTRNKKKSTRCRMVFRTTVTHDDGSTEVLQTTSQPIVCTQPPGIPEICKKSVSACPSSGGLELFILGKNFLKDTKVVFQQSDSEPCWEETVQPDKEYLQQTHLVCVVPPYRRVDIADPVTVKLMVSSSGKMSEPHTFTYLPTTNPVVATALQVPVGAAETLLPPPGEWLPAPVPLKERPAAQLSRVLLQRHKAGGDAKEALLLWSKPTKLLPPPPLLPLPARVALAPLKTEAVGGDEGPEDLRTKQPPPPMATVADLSSTQSPSMATFRQFVSDSNFLAQSAHSIEKYLNHIECKEAAAPTAADKLDALVNSAADTHMAPVMMEAPPATSPIAVKQMMMEAPTATSPIAVKQMMMEGPTATSPIAVKQMMMDAPSTSPIAVKQMMMDTPSTSPIVVKQMMMDDSSTSPIVVKQMMMDDPSTSPIVVKQMIMDSSSTSPIAVKQMMMDPPSTSPIAVNQMMMEPSSTSPIAVNQMMMDAPATSPIAVKQMMMEPPVTSPIAVKQMMMDAPSSSPIAVQQMMMESPSSSSCSSPIAVKQMMMDAPVKQMMMEGPGASCTPPIAVKQIMMDTPSTSPIAVQQMMMESPSSSSCSSPIAVKQMMMDAPVKQMMMDTPSTSPIAVQQMMMESPSSSSCSSPIAVKQMMMDAPVKQMMMDAPATSPIAVKQMIMESPPHPAVCTSPIAIKTMLLGGAVGAPLNAILNQAAPGEPSPLCSLIAPVGAAPPTTPQPPSAPTLLDAVYRGSAGGLLMAATGAEKMGDAPQMVDAPAAPQQPAPSAAPAAQKKCEEGMLPQELTQMSDNDLISYINPSTFDAV